MRASHHVQRLTGQRPQALIHAVYVPAVCRAVLTALRLEQPSAATIPPLAALAQALAQATDAPPPTPQQSRIAAGQEATPCKRPRQSSPVNEDATTHHASHLGECVARLLLPMLRRAAVLLALVLDAQPPTAPCHTAPAWPELLHWQALLRLPPWTQAVGSVLAMPDAALWLERWVGGAGPLLQRGPCNAPCSAPPMKAATAGVAQRKRGEGACDGVEAAAPTDGVEAVAVPYPPALQLLPLPRVCQVWWLCFSYSVEDDFSGYSLPRCAGYVPARQQEALCTLRGGAIAAGAMSDMRHPAVLRRPAVQHGRVGHGAA